jgi:hypothetical protein
MYNRFTLPPREERFFQFHTTGDINLVIYTLAMATGIPAEDLTSRYVFKGDRVRNRITVTLVDHNDSMLDLGVFLDKLELEMECFINETIRFDVSRFFDKIY